MNTKDYREPDWGNVGKVHNWKNYISVELRLMWPWFTDDQKRALVDNAQEIADREEWD